MATENVKASWSISLDCKCPACKIKFDVLRLAAQPVQSGSMVPLEVDTVASRDIEVKCPACDHEFLVDCEY
jgi:phage FluMu protein Com